MENDCNRKRIDFERESILRSKFKIIAFESGYLTATPEYDDGIDLIMVDRNVSPFKTYFIQLKSRFTLDKKYFGKSCHMAFYDSDTFYFLEYDLLQEIALTNYEYKHFIEKGIHHTGKMSESLREKLICYKFESPKVKNSPELA